MGICLGVHVTARIINHVAEGFFQASVGVSRGSLQTEHPPGEVLTSFRRQREGHDRPIMVDPDLTVPSRRWSFFRCAARLQARPFEPAELHVELDIEHAF